jgi:GntR family transcriptional regulator
MIRIQPGSSQPIYQQITDAVARSIASGALRPGESLPSIRELAAELVVNPNTVVRAFAELVRLGLVSAQPGRGHVVLARQQVFTPAERRRQLQDQALALATTALRIGASLSETQQALAKAWNHDPKHAGAPTDG